MSVLVFVEFGTKKQSTPLDEHQKSPKSFELKYGTELTLNPT